MESPYVRQQPATQKVRVMRTGSSSLVTTVNVDDLERCMAINANIASASDCKRILTTAAGPMTNRCFRRRRGVP